MILKVNLKMPFLSLTDKKERDRIAKEYAGLASRLKDKFQKEKIADDQAKEKLIQKTAPVTSVINSAVLGDPDDEDTEKAIIPVLKKQTAELKKDNEALKKQQEIQNKELKKITSAVQNIPVDLSDVLDQKTEGFELDEIILNKNLKNEIFDLDHEFDANEREIIENAGYELPSEILANTATRSLIENIYHTAKNETSRLGNGLHGKDPEIIEIKRKKWDTMKKYVENISIMIKKLEKFEKNISNIESKSGNATDSENVIESQEGGGSPICQTTCIYYSDPNELIERLQLLVASKNAGNNGVLNEISAILDELHKRWDLSKDDYISLNKNLLS